MTNKKPELWPYQQAFLDFLKTFNSGFHSGGLVPAGGVTMGEGEVFVPLISRDYPLMQQPSRVHREGRKPVTTTITITNSKLRRSTPRTDDMIQMLADFERHGYGRKRLIISMVDEVSTAVHKMRDELDRASLSMARLGRFL